MGSCTTKPEPTTADVIVRFDRIHEKLTNAIKQLNRAKALVLASNQTLEKINMPDAISVRSIEKILIAIERDIDRIDRL